jgi:hypothetical protein
MSTLNKYGVLRLFLNFITSVFVISGGIELESTPIIIAGVGFFASWIFGLAERLSD